MRRVHEDRARLRPSAGLNAFGHVNAQVLQEPAAGAAVFARRIDKRLDLPADEVQPDSQLPQTGLSEAGLEITRDRIVVLVDRDGKAHRVLHPQRLPTPWSGRDLLMVLTQRAERPSWSLDPVRAKKPLPAGSAQGQTACA